MNGIPFVSEGTASKPETNRPYIKSVDSEYSKQNKSMLQLI